VLSAIYKSEVKSEVSWFDVLYTKTCFWSGMWTIDVVCGPCRDDLTLLGQGEGAGVLPRFAQAIRKAGDFYGFVFPPEKCKDSEELDGEEFKHLGMLWTIKDLLSQSVWTKRELFAAAGHASVGNDILLQHPELRALGDLLRRLAEIAYDDCYRCLVRLARIRLVLLAICGSATDNSTASDMDGNLPSWELAASSTTWKGAQLVYHINRLELVSLSRLVLWIVDTLGSSPPAPLRTIVFNCDSSVVLNWVRRGRTSTKTTERLSVKRILNNVNELLCALSDGGIVIRYKKIEGGLNQRADGLSRLVQEYQYDDIFSSNKVVDDVDVVTRGGRSSVPPPSGNSDVPSIPPEVRQRFIDAQSSSPSLKVII
ncbi:hypothetical protein FOZ61_002943, partial [Perkinsus olseni]